MSNASKGTTPEQKYKLIFQENKNQINDISAQPLNKERDESINIFNKIGLPSIKDENYRNTNLIRKYVQEYKFDFKHEVFEKQLEEIFTCKVSNLKATTIYLINGWYYRKNNENLNLPEGVILGSLLECAKEYPELFDKHYNKYAKNNQDGNVALNTAFAQDGFFLYIPKGVVMQKPLQIVNIQTTEKPMMSFVRNLIVIEENAQAKIMFCEHSITQPRYFVNNVTEAFVGTNGMLDVYSLQSQHKDTTNVSSVFVKQMQNSSILTHNVTLYAGITRNNIFVEMAEEYCEARVYGLYVIDEKQHVDNFSFIDHAKPNCYSDELFKGVLDNSATAAFSGKIMVRPDAQNTSAFQRNNNLLLTEEAKVTTKPQLEIYADDVKCSHGATVGQLDDEALFYLRSRGISRQEAQILLMYAFAYEALEKIRVDEVREEIRYLVELVFRGDGGKCNKCF